MCCMFYLDVRRVEEKRRKKTPAKEELFYNQLTVREL